MYFIPKRIFKLSFNSWGVRYIAKIYSVNEEVIYNQISIGKKQSKQIFKISCEGKWTYNSINSMYINFGTMFFNIRKKKFLY